MIYPSSAGSIDASTGKDAAIVLKKPNGDVIKPVLKPSTLDIEGLRKIYTVPPRDTTGLLNSKGSRWLNKFKVIKSKDPDTGCN